MKTFINNTRIDINAYGYRFRPGIPTEVDNELFERKFSMYPTLDEVTDHGVQETQEGQGEDAGQTPVLTPNSPRAQIMALLDELGISYNPRSRTVTLHSLLEEAIENGVDENPAG